MRFNRRFASCYKETSRQEDMSTQKNLLVLQSDSLEVSGVGDLFGASSDFLPVVWHASESVELDTAQHRQGA